MVLICHIIVHAQSWETTYHEGDELTGESSYTSYMYTDENGNSFVFQSNHNDDFRIISSSGIFDYVGDIKSFYATIGLYDNNDKLVEKLKIQFIALDGNADQAQPNLIPMIRPIPNPNRCKKTIDYLKNKKGYIRIVAPLYGSHLDFKIKVPCMKQAYPLTSAAQSGVVCSQSEQHSLRLGKESAEDSKKKACLRHATTLTPHSLLCGVYKRSHLYKVSKNLVMFPSILAFTSSVSAAF